MQPLWKTVWRFLKKKTTIRSNNSISGYLFKGNENTNLKRYMFPYVHCSIKYPRYGNNMRVHQRTKNI